jgi:NhaP-type Na+/H+ or K+/H+ antiporter
LFGLWDVLPFLLNSVLFILIGLQLPNILGSISGEYSMMSVVLDAALVNLAVTGTAARMTPAFRAGTTRGWHNRTER